MACLRSYRKSGRAPARWHAEDGIALFLHATPTGWRLHPHSGAGEYVPAACRLSNLACRLWYLDVFYLNIVRVFRCDPAWLDPEDFPD